MVENPAPKMKVLRMVYVFVSVCLFVFGQVFYCSILSHIKSKADGGYQPSAGVNCYATAKLIFTAQ